MAKKTSRKNNLNELYTALDFMMSGNHSSVAGSDFLMSRKSNPNYGYIDPDDINDYNQDFIDTIIKLKPINKIELIEAVEKAKSIVLEPIMKTEITTPDNYLGEIIGDINSKRGQINNQSTIGNAVIVNAHVPLKEMFGYISALRSMSQGRATYSMIFDSYQEVLCGAF